MAVVEPKLILKNEERKKSLRLQKIFELKIKDSNAIAYKRDNTSGGFKFIE